MVGGANPIDSRRSSDLHRGDHTKLYAYDNIKGGRTIKNLLIKQNDTRVVVNCGKVKMCTLPL